MTEQYIKYFTGLKRNYGFCNISNGYKDPNTGKIKFHSGDYGWSGKPITDQDYQLHLEGKKSIGIQPCDDNGYARFGAIDIDPKIYKDLDIQFYLKIIQDKELPLIPIKSKSSGLHLYVFTKEFVKAKEIKDFLEQVLFLFNLPITTEIFPKQTKLGSNTEGDKINGNFINLPYFSGSERVALDPSGKEMSLDLFLKCVELNQITSKQLKEISDGIIRKELTGGNEEFKDGPPCLEILSKNKMTDGRDRFLYNYMVFAKKKYPDSWKNKVLQAGRNYFEFDQTWTDDYITKKIKNWEKDTKGHTCHDPLLAPVCIKSECIKRSFGILSDKKITWPRLTNLVKVDFKPDPEYYFDVERDDGETVSVHARNKNEIKDQNELRGLIMAQADELPPPIKSMEFYEIIKVLLATQDTVQPAPGTTPIEILKKHLKYYIHNTQATSYNSFKSGNVLKDKEFAYFVYDEFYNDLKDNDWKKDSSRTSYMIEKMFEKEDESLPRPQFDRKKRFPGKDKKTGKSYPGVNGCAVIPLYLFEKDEDDEDVVEITEFKKEEEIV
jgi:hypothetical protein